MSEPADAGARPAPRCPICGKPRAERYRPFCSAACRDRDLLRWVRGEYAIPSARVEPEVADGEDADEG